MQSCTNSCMRSAHTPSRSCPTSAARPALRLPATSRPSLQVEGRQETGEDAAHWRPSTCTARRRGRACSRVPVRRSSSSAHRAFVPSSRCTHPSRFNPTRGARLFPPSFRKSLPVLLLASFSRRVCVPGRFLPVHTSSEPPAHCSRISRRKPFSSADTHGPHAHAAASPPPTMQPRRLLRPPPRVIRPTAPDFLTDPGHASNRAPRPTPRMALLHRVSCASAL